MLLSPGQQQGLAILTMPLILYTCLLCLCVSSLWANQAEDASTVSGTESHSRGLAPTNVDFAFSLYQRLVASAPDRNIFISPVSISMALAMLSLGTSGHTRTQLLQALGFNLTRMSDTEIHQNFRHLYQLLKESDTSLEMAMGNALFLNHNLHPQESFLAAIKCYYESEALAADFQNWTSASRQINEYISNKTQGKLMDMFSEPDSPAILILINYIYFGGTWEQPFNPESTQEKNFHVNETTTVTVPMMFWSGSVQYLQDPVLPCRLVQLHFTGNGTVFLILPDQGQMDTVIARLSRDTIQRWSDSLTQRPVDLYLPKLSVSSAYDLRDVLTEMGFADLFSSQANFSAISQEAPLKLSKVVHKAMLHMDERGRKEAADPGVTVKQESEPVTFAFDHPFLVLIFDNFTWSSLLLGKVLDPSEVLLLKGGVLGLHTGLMRVTPGLLLSVLLVELLAPSWALGPLSPEYHADLESLEREDPLSQTWGATPAPPDDEKKERDEEEEEDEEEAQLRTHMQQLSNATSNFGFNLLRKISMTHDGNVVFSPLGMALAMAGLMLGAEGQTRAQVEHGLQLQALGGTQPLLLPTLFKRLRQTLSSNVELGLAQGSFAFIHKDFQVNETFLNLSKRYFDTECVPTNFHNASQARGLMNYYINKATQGKIPKLFDGINPETKLILVDYILFKGKWLTPFDPVLTEADTFHLDKYRAVEVPMMYREGRFAYTFDSNFHCHVLQLPYRGNAAMLVVLMEKMGDHLDLEDYLTTDLVETWLRNMQTRKMEVFFPKFKLDQKYEMHELLKQMGVRRIFSPLADLGGLSATPRNLQVSKVVQQSVIEVDEKGTEAVTGTLSEIIAYFMPPTVKVDRPFHFMIYEETSRMLLFLGRVVDPTLL
ncbi:protein Z-dependent protease inhibitor [Octodon degus]|uniref:Corticosteroid-binding globulin n=1 Tax=Octodon degus TaxID=10160 RepID=A0A6P3VC64_OCTDE|nr:protein Z-dependent protease inhibitor [Octodon degus]